MDRERNSSDWLRPFLLGRFNGLFTIHAACKKRRGKKLRKTKSTRKWDWRKSQGLNIRRDVRESEGVCVFVTHLHFTTPDASPELVMVTPRFVGFIFKEKEPEGGSLSQKSSFVIVVLQLVFLRICRSQKLFNFSS